jgi:serine O-acetyltransferase
MDNTHKITLKTTWQHIKSDFARYREMENRSNAANLILSPGLVATLYYRLGHWIWYADSRSALLLFRPLYMIGKRLIEIYAGMSLSPRAIIGPGLYFSHFGSIFIGASRIGENCTFAHQITIGVSGRGAKRGLPQIGDRVSVGPGAKILGKITIGDDVTVGANAVVNVDLPDGAIAEGIPARIITSKRGFDSATPEALGNSY